VSIYITYVYAVGVKYRSRSEIIAMILEAANNGATKTRIMYGACLSYAQVKEYLEFLRAKKLISYEEGASLYHLTGRGLKYLRIYEEISEMISVAPSRAQDQVVILGQNSRQ
jgi:predicted transcriptional regulator